MEILLSNAEFFALAAMLRATSIAALDPAEITPADPAERQKMYDAGEKLLLQRGLMRLNERNEAQLEENLLAAMSAITQPHHFFLAIKNTLGIGRQLFAFYAADKGFFERTRPTAQTHRLASVENIASRLAAIFPVPDSAANDGLYFAMPMDSFFALRGQLAQGNTAPLEELAASAPEPARAALMAFARDAAHLLFEGSVSFAPPEPSSQTTETTTRDIGLMCASDGAWLITPHATQADAVDVNSISAAGLNRVWQMALAQN